MIVLAGLGNPGSEYATTRHNIGFMAIDCIQSYYSCSPFLKKDKLFLSKGTIGDVSVILCKPISYMNLSGVALAPLIRFYRLPLENLYVIHDDIALKAFEIRTKQGGGHAGHNGLRNIDQHIGNNYHRIRIGVGHPGHKDDVSSYVLSSFQDQEQKILVDVLDTLCKNIENLLKRQ